MTTSITDIVDLTRILNEQPEWRDAVRSILLGQELMDLPRRLAEYTQNTDRRLDALEAGQARLEAALAEFMAATNRRLEALEAGQARLETALAEFMGATNLRLGNIETALAEFKEVTNRRLDTLEAGQVELKDGQARLETALAEFMESTNRRLDALEAGQAKLEAGQVRLEAGQAKLEAGQAKLEAGQAKLEAGQAQHSSDIAEIKAEQVSLRKSVNKLEKRVDQLTGTVGRLVGADLERKVHANIIGIASRVLGLNRGRILQSEIVARGPDLQDIIDDAEERGIITADQGGHLEQADIIISGRRKSDRQQCYVVVEVSAGIRNDDIIRARDRAQTLAAVSQMPVIPTVVGGSIAHQQRSLADREGVAVVISRSLNQEMDPDNDLLPDE